VEQVNVETQETSWVESHPWLSKIPETEEEDSIGEVVRYTLDELRFA